VSHYCPFVLIRLYDQLWNQTLGVYDALQKKYLKTLLFCICEEEGPMIEEYACKFCPCNRISGLIGDNVSHLCLLRADVSSVSFSYPNTSTEEVAMNMSRTGSKKGSTTFTSNASEVTPDQMRYFLTLDADFLA